MTEAMLAEGGWGFLIFLGIVIMSAVFDSLKKSKDKNKKKSVRSPRPAAQERRSPSPRENVAPTTTQRSPSSASRPQGEPTSPAEALRRLMEDMTGEVRPSPAPASQFGAARQEAAEKAERLKEMEELARQKRIQRQTDRSQSVARQTTQKQLRQTPSSAHTQDQRSRQAVTLTQTRSRSITTTAMQLRRIHAARMREALILSEILQPPLTMRGGPGGHRPR